MLRAILIVGTFASLLTAAADAREVEVAIGISVPPFVIPDEQRGMEYDIVKSALAIEGHVMKPHFLPPARAVRAMEGGTADAALTQQPESGLQAHYSDVHITYHNVAITLASRGTRIERVEDLAGKSVVAFQKASAYLGPGFQKIAASNPGYREEAKQTAQPILLYLGRTDVVITDPAIFLWFAHSPEVAARADISQPICIHPVFPPTEYRVAFRDPELRDSFNRGLARLRQTGEYARIVARYAQPAGNARN